MMSSFFFCLSISFFFFALFSLSVKGEETAVANNLFDFKVYDASDELISLSKYANAKAILVVNVASNCGFTYTNYLELTEMYNRLHDKGLEILAFPCNQFGEQEPGSNEEIQIFTQNFGVNFPVFGKVKNHFFCFLFILSSSYALFFPPLLSSLSLLLLLFPQLDVNGPGADPLYKFLKNFSDDSSEIGWNFAKFLVVRGYPVKRYNSRISPKKIEKDILRYLGEGGGEF